MKLTKEEKEFILSKRKQDESNKPKLTGVLKHDLYCIDEHAPEITINIKNIIEEKGWYLTTDELDEMIQLLATRFGEFLKIKKGSMFDCYIDDGKESWYDSVGFGIEEASADWARKNLKDIKEVK